MAIKSFGKIHPVDIQCSECEAIISYLPVNIQCYTKDEEFVTCEVCGAPIYLRPQKGE